MDIEDDGRVTDLSAPDVVDKYRTAAEVTNNALKAVAAACVPGASVVDLCKLGDEFIIAEVAKTYAKAKGISKGVAFPTCVSINDCVAHNCPLEGDTAVIADGDTVKIDLACHIDGFCAPVAYTINVVAPGTEITGAKADTFLAAQTAIDAAIRMIKPGNKNSDVTEAIAQSAAAFGVHVVEGVLSHEVKQHVIDGQKTIQNKPTPEQYVDAVDFEPYEVYAVDVFMSSSDVKPKEVDEKQCNVYKRDAEGQYALKMKASRMVMSEITKRFSTFPFSLKAFGEDAARAKLGITECAQHGLLNRYPVLHADAGAEVAHIKVTVLVLPSGTQPITGLPDSACTYTSEKSVPEGGEIKLANGEVTSLKAVLAEELRTKKKKKKNKAKKAGDGEGGQ